MHQYATTCASTISQRAALAAFTEEGRAAGEKLRTELLARRNFLIEMIDHELLEALAPTFGPPRVVPDGAFYVLLNISRFGTSFEVAERLLDNKVITIPGSAFGEEAEGFLRLSFATDYETIREGVRRIKEGLSV
jgi:aspartate/methionine/tyrosine aminotransferase